MNKCSDIVFGQKLIVLGSVLIDFKEIMAISVKILNLSVLLFMQELLGRGVPPSWVLYWSMLSMFLFCQTNKQIWKKQKIMNINFDLMFLYDFYARNWFRIMKIPLLTQIIKIWQKNIQKIWKISKTCEKYSDFDETGWKKIRIEFPTTWNPWKWP